MSKEAMMRMLIAGLAAGLTLPGAAVAQDQPGAPKPERCAPFSRDVFLGFCTKQEQADAKARIAAQSAGTVQPPPPSPPKATDGARVQAGGKTASVALSSDDIRAVDLWIARQPDKLSREEALHRLVQKGLMP